VPERAVGAREGAVTIMKNNRVIPYRWAGVTGLLFPLLQALIYYVRFGTLNPYAPVFDYVLFFLGGTLGGFVLIALLRRSETMAAKSSVGLAFLLGYPWPSSDRWAADCWDRWAWCSSRC